MKCTVSSMVVTIILKLDNQAASPLFINMVSVYAPTHRGRRISSYDLQNVVNGISKDDLLVVMGDFNAHV